MAVVLQRQRQALAAWRARIVAPRLATKAQQSQPHARTLAPPQPSSAPSYPRSVSALFLTRPPVLEALQHRTALGAAAHRCIVHRLPFLKAALPAVSLPARRPELSHLAHATAPPSLAHSPSTQPLQSPWPSPSRRLLLSHPSTPFPLLARTHARSLARRRRSRHARPPDSPSLPAPPCRCTRTPRASSHSCLRGPALRTPAVDIASFALADTPPSNPANRNTTPALLR